MPEKLQMTPGGLEEKLYGVHDARTFGLSRNASAETMLILFLILLGILLPVINAFTELQIFTTQFWLREQTDPDLYLFQYKLAMGLAVICAVLMSTLNLLIVKRRLNHTRSILRESDLLVRVLTGWEPNLNENRFRSWLRRHELMLLRQDTLLGRLSFVFSNLAYHLGLRTRPLIPAVQYSLAMIPLLVITGGLAYFTHTPFERAGQFVLAAAIANLFFHPFIATFVEGMLLREHLREIDNGVLDVELTEGIMEAIDA